MLSKIFRNLFDGAASRRVDASVPPIPPGHTVLKVLA
jgi:hypothetical protein